MMLKIMSILFRAHKILLQRNLFLKIRKANSCPNWAKITVNIKTPKASTDLKNKKFVKHTYFVDAGMISVITNGAMEKEKRLPQWNME